MMTQLPIQSLEARRLCAASVPRAPILEDLVVIQADRQQVHIDILQIKTVSHADALAAVAGTSADRHRIEEDVRRLHIDQVRSPQQVFADEAVVRMDETALATDIRNDSLTARADLLAGRTKLWADQGTLHNDIEQLLADRRSGI